jgi:hypothetical protein
MRSSQVLAHAFAVGFLPRATQGIPVLSELCPVMAKVLDCKHTAYVDQDGAPGRMDKNAKASTSPAPSNA